MNLTGKTAIVTGGSGAIGSAIAARLARLDCDVALIDRVASADAFAAIEAAGRRAFRYEADLGDAAGTRAAVASAVEALGGLDILVNSAGVSSFGPAATLADEEWARVIAINLTGVFTCCQAAIAPLKLRGAGRIINIGSILAKNGGNARPWLDPAEQARSGNVAYGVSKAGVHAMTAYLARELAAFAITVNGIAPGPIASAMTRDFPESLRAMIPLGRIGQPDDVAQAVAFLASDAAAFITGEILDVNGGSWSD